MYKSINSEIDYLKNQFIKELSNQTISFKQKSID